MKLPEPTAPATMTFHAPARWLSANDRGAWRTHATVIRAWRNFAAWNAIGHKLPAHAHRVHIVIEVHKRHRLRYDVANLAPTGKAIVDGLVDAGVLVDDDNAHVIGPDMRVGDVRECEGVTVTITPIGGVA